MKMWKILLPVIALLLFAGPGNAQTDEDDELREMEFQKEEYSERLREAEEHMEMAARRVAEITQERLPKMREFARRIQISNTPRLGITIEGSEKSGQVDGVEIQGVTPDSAAADAGLHAGDVITAINGESMSARSSDAANDRLLEFMQGVEEGDELKVEYLREGNAGSVELSPKVMENHVFSWVPDGENVHIERIPGVPGFVQKFKFESGFPFAGGPWGRMELVELNEGLGKYFGTDTGLLVVSAPEGDGLELQDGDVIQTIDGRKPTDVRHAMRILGSYEGGEKLELGIMRDKKKRKLDIEVPADHRSSLFAPPAVAPARAPVPSKPPKPPLDDVST